MPSQIDGQIGPLAGGEVPHGGALVALSFMDHHQALVTGNGRPARCPQRHARVGLLRHHSSGAGIDHAKRWMDEIAVLGVLETQQ